MDNLILFFLNVLGTTLSTAILMVPFIVLITVRYMDKKLSHIKSNIANMFTLFPKSLANVFIYSGGIIANGRYGKKSIFKRTYGDLKMRDYARPIDKFLSFSFWACIALANISALIWFSLEWYQHGFPSHLFGF